MLRKHTTGFIRSVVCFVFVVAITTAAMPTKVFALGGLDNRFDQISNSTVSATAIHRIGFTITQTATPLGSIEMEFCANDPLPNTACTIPVGLDLTGITMTQSGNTGFSIDPSSTANRLLLTRFPALPLGGPSVYTLNNVINPSNPGSYYVRLQTFASNDGSGVAVEDGGLVFVMNSGFNVSSTVPPYLRFCAGVVITSYDCSSATSYLIDMGEFSPGTTSGSSSEMVVATNAGFGYSITMSGTTLTSGNNVIPALTSQTAPAAGTSQFGINLRANSNPAIGADPNGPGIGTVNATYNVPNVYKFASGDILASSTGSTDNRKYTLSYMTNVSPAQTSGVYATTLSFICLANF